MIIFTIAWSNWHLDHEAVDVEESKIEDTPAEINEDKKEATNNEDDSFKSSRNEMEGGGEEDTDVLA